MKRIALLCLILYCALGVADDVEWSIENYEEREVHGFTIYICKEALEEFPETTETAYDFVEMSLVYLRHRLYVNAFDKLADQVKIEINNELSEKLHAGAYYDSVRKFIVFPKLRATARMVHTSPGKMIHELAHAFHDLFLPNGFENELIKQYYERAVESGKYKRVKYLSAGTHTSGDQTEVRAYLLQNAREYFAEISEALWSQNRHEPFTLTDVLNDKVLTDWCEDDMTVSAQCETNPDYKFNPVWNAWWKYSGPHKEIWYHQTLDQIIEPEGSL